MNAKILVGAYRGYPLYRSKRMLAALLMFLVYFICLYTYMVNNILLGAI